MSRLKLKTEFYIAAASVSIVLLIVGIWGITSVIHSKNCLKSIKESQVSALNLLGDLRDAQAIISEYEAIVLNPFTKETVTAGTLRKQETDAWLLIESTMKEYGAVEKLPDHEKKWKSFLTVFQEWKDAHQSVLRTSVINDSVNNNAFEVQSAFSFSLLKSQALSESIKVLQNVHLTAMDQIQAKNDTNANITILILSILIITGFVIAFVFGIFFNRVIIKPVNTIIAVLKECNEGNLRPRANITHKNEVGDLAQTLDSFVNKLETKIVGGMYKLAQGEMIDEIYVSNNDDQVAPAMNTMVQTLNNVMQEISIITTHAIDGDLEYRGEATDFNGVFQDIIQKVDETLDAIITPLNAALEILTKLSDKDLTVRIQNDFHGDYQQLKQAINQAMENLDTSLSKVAMVAQQVTVATDQINAGSQSVAQAASEQASSLEEVSSSLHELASLTKQNAGNTNEAKDMATKIESNASHIRSVMDSMAQKMELIKSSSDETVTIVKTIDEIAFQTNLLALNAAVEAARAGEAGKGFAVVAEEVRNLAIRSAEAAKNTSALIESSKQNTDEGVKMTGDMNSVLMDMIRDISDIAQIIFEVSEAGNEQSRGIEQVTATIGELNTITQQFAATSEETASSAQEVNSQVHELEKLVIDFNISQKNSYMGSEPVLSFNNSRIAEKDRRASGYHSADPEKIIPFGDEPVDNDFVLNDF